MPGAHLRVLLLVVLELPIPEVPAVAVLRVPSANARAETARPARSPHAKRARVVSITERRDLQPETESVASSRRTAGGRRGGRAANLVSGRVALIHLSPLVRSRRQVVALRVERISIFREQAPSRSRLRTSVCTLGLAAVSAQKALRPAATAAALIVITRAATTAQEAVF